MKKKQSFFFLIHLYELKINFFYLLLNFFYLLLISYFFSNEILYLLIKSLLNTKTINHFILTDVTEAFILKILISFFSSFFILIPFLCFQIWFIILPGLYIYENIKIYKLFIYYFSFFYINNFYIFYYLLPSIWHFFYMFISLQQEFICNIFLEPKLYTFVFFIFNIILYYNLLCLIIFILIIFLKLNYNLNIKKLIYYKKNIFLFILFLSIFITPPDFLSQFLICIPFFFCFEIIIFFLILKQNYNKK